MKTRGLALALCLIGGIALGAGGNQGNTPADAYEVFAYNDLGMHCMDREFSVFSILPPFNVLDAQVVRRSATGKPVLVDGTSIEVRYSPVADATRSINSTSRNKTDFWLHAAALFGMNLRPGQGLTGYYMPRDQPTTRPQAMGYDATHKWFSGFGIPITPHDDAGNVNPYPLLRVSAYDKLTGALLAQTDAVVPVAQETDCQNCHITGGIAARDPGIVWSHDPDPEKQTKHNVLILHDVRQGTALELSTPVLCASCHYSPALDLSGQGPQGDQVGKPLFSHVMHNFHGKLTDDQGQPLFPPDGSADATCYQCHPGATTQCQRGAMRSGGLECKDCHGSMLAVGGEYPLLPGGSIDGQNDGQARRPWLDLPRCQSCHTGDAVSHLQGGSYVMAGDGIRLMQAFLIGDQSASPILATNKRFAENLNARYRFSGGHASVACESCHGSTHAEWPIEDPAANDNVTARQLQGHTGPIIECGTCHAAGTLKLTTSGPHGLHNVNDPRWVDEQHGDFFERDQNGCKACHGLNLEGTVLARVAADRTFAKEHGTIKLKKGDQVSCTLCHEKPN
ncbi:MAG: hypothetical protein U1E76_05065 [Planctomycetota bacterium]